MAASNSILHRRFSAVLGICFALSLTLADVYAQTPVPARIVSMPLPVWRETEIPADGIPRAYFDASANQIVVGSKLPSGTTTATRRFDLANGALPTITTSITGEPKSRLTYSYAAADDPNSPQRTQRIALVLPEHDTSIVARGAWTHGTEPTSLPDHSGAVGFAKMRLVSWRDPSSSNSKIAGVGFEIDSNYLPGFVDVLVWGQAANPLRPELVNTLPLEVRPSLSQYLETRYDASKQILLGPLFRPDTPKSLIAANYHFALQHLMKRDRIQRASPYAEALLQNLTTFLSASSPAFTFPSERPKPGLETEIDKALRTALSQ